MESTETFNLIEAVFWMGLACLAAFRALTGIKQRRLILIVLSILLFLFGCTDLFEITSGAWWKPWWLLLWKVSCFAGILLTFLFLIKIRNRKA
jgi:hypothetical protein